MLQRLFVYSQMVLVLLAIAVNVNGQQDCAEIDAVFLNVSGSEGQPACRCYSNSGPSHGDWIGCTGQSMPAVFRALNALNGTEIDHLYIWDSLLNILPADMFSKILPKTLTIEASAVSVFREGSLSGLGASLKKLNLRRNIFKSVDKKLFSGMYQVEALDMSNNKIAKLLPSTFAELKSLKTLSLHANAISRIDDGCFEGLNKLKKLDLSNNHITTISSDLFKGLDELEELDLKDNAIATVDWSAFQKLPKLRLLDLGSNKLANIKLQNIPRLERLSVANNAITSLSNVLLRNLPNLKALSLDHNKLTNVEDGDFAGLESSQRLISLSLGYNAITEISAHAFVSLPNLVTLWLAGNKLTSLTDETPEGNVTFLQPLKSLRRLFLDHNQIVKVDNAFSQLRSLEIIALNNNYLKEIAKDAFEGITPRMLFLNNNSLYYLPEGVFSSFDFSQLTSVDLSDNPWECICGKEWLGNWLRSIGDANNAQGTLGCLDLKCDDNYLPRQQWITYLAVIFAIITILSMIGIGYLLVKENTFRPSLFGTLRRVPSDMVQLIPDGMSFPNPTMAIPDPPKRNILKSTHSKPLSNLSTVMEEPEGTSPTEKKQVRFNGI